MREISSVNTGMRRAEKSRYYSAGVRKRRLNKKRFVAIFVLFIVLIVFGLLGTGFVLKQFNIEGPITEPFNAVQKILYPDQQPAVQPTLEIAAAAPAPSENTALAQTPAEINGSGDKTLPETGESGGADTENTNLPAFMQSGEGDMKAFSIDGIDPDSDKVVALTFDDGPNPSSTGEILDALKEYGGHATFFVLGERAEQFPSTIKKIYDGGNEIGNHSYGHPDFKNLSTEDMLQEIEKTNDSVFKAVGARPILVRPPYGSITPELADTIGRACVLWTVDPEDWKYKDADIDYDNVMNVVQDGDIVLMHDIYQESAKAAKRIIKELNERGYKLVTVSQMVQIAEARGKEVEPIICDLKVRKDKDQGAETSAE